MKKQLLRFFLILALSAIAIVGALGVVGFAADGSDETAPSPENAIAYRLADGTLQLEWDAVSGCELYRVYADGKLVNETDLSIAIVEGGARYTVSAVFGETEGIAASFSVSGGSFVQKDTLFEDYCFVSDELGTSSFYDGTISLTDDLATIREVLCDRTASAEDVFAAQTIVTAAKNTVLTEKRNLVGVAKSVSISPDPFNADYLQEYLYDGNLSTRFAAYRYSKTESIIVAEFDLGGIYSVSEIEIYEFANEGIARSETTAIELWVNGEWIEVLAPTDTNTLGVGNKSNYHSILSTPSDLQASKVRVTLARLQDGSNKNLSIWELYIWGRCFNLNGEIGAPVVNEQKPTSTTVALAENFSVGSVIYTDRASANNLTSAAHVGEALRGLKQIRLPIIDSSRSSSEELKSFLSGDNVYFTFEAESDGTVYVVFPSALVNFSEQKGWRCVANGKRISLPSGENLTTLDREYSDPTAPYYLTRLQETTTSVNNAVAFTYCYALDFKKGETVQIPTPAIEGGLTSENLVVLVDCVPTAPELSGIYANGEFFAPDGEDNVFVRVPENATTVTLDALTLAGPWKTTFSPSATLTLDQGFQKLTASVSSETETRTYNIVVYKENSKILLGVPGKFEGAHYEGYFNGNNIQANVDKLTDGNTATYSKTWHSTPRAGVLIFRYDLAAYYDIDTFSIRSNAVNGISLLGEITVEALVDGSWVKASSFDLASVGTISGGVVFAEITESESVHTNAIRFVCDYNPAAVTDNQGASLSNSSLLIYELGAGYKSFTVHTPELTELKVNGVAPKLENGKYYVGVDENAKQLVVEAETNSFSTVVSYEPASSVAFNGKRKVITVTATNVLGKTKSYTIVADPVRAKENVLLDATASFVGASNTHPDYPLSYVNDGNTGTRLACRSAMAYELEFRFDGAYDLTEMKFYAYVHGANTLTGKVTVRALYGSEWVDVAVCDTSSYVLYASNNGLSTFALDIKGVSAVRIHIEQNPNMPNNGPSIWEIDIQGAPSAQAPENFLLGVEPSFVTEVSLHDGYPLTALTDGNTASRLAARSTAAFEVEFPLDGTYDLHTFVLYTYTHGGLPNTGTVTLRGLVGEQWIELAVLDMRTDFTNTVSNTAYKCVYLNMREVSALRIHVTHNEELGKGASIWEVVAYGSKTPEEDKEQNPFDGFEIFSSVTIHNGFDVNVFLPASDEIEALSFGGVSYDPDALTPIELGARSYYKLTLGVDAKWGCEGYALTVTLNKDAKQSTKTYAISLSRYLSSLMASGATKAEKAIAIDVLAYIRAAIVYFNPDIDTSDAYYEDYLNALDSLDGILSRYSYVEQIPESLGTPSTAPITGTGVARAAFSLDSNLSFVLELADGYELDDFTFLVGGAPATVTLVDGYVYVTVYAYRIKDTLSWTVADKDDPTLIHRGELSLATYYASSSVQNSPDLSRLVERLVSFSESAAAYIAQLPVTLTARYETEDGASLGVETITRNGGSSYCIYPPSFEGYYTKDLCIRGTMTYDKTITVTYGEIPENADPAVIASLIPGVVCWGDSLTAGAGNTNLEVASTYGIDLQALGSTAKGGNYTTVLSNLIAARVAGGVRVDNCGVGGETSAVIAARAMTETYYLYVGEAVTVAPQGSCTIDIQQYSSTGRLGILRQGKADLINAVTILAEDTLGNEVEVTGNITLALREGAENIYTCPYTDLVYTFTRTDSGTTEVTLEKGAKIVTRCSYAFDGEWCVIFMGQNGGYSSFDELIAQQREILEACDCTDKFVIIGLSSGTASDRAAMESALSEYWGDHYFSARAYLSSADTLSLAGFGEDEIADVAAEIESGKISRLLLHDNTHLNAVGYALLANAVFERMADLGFFNPVFEYYESLK